METYRILLGGEEGVDYGSFPAETPEAGLLIALAEADHTRRYRVRLLSTSPAYGRAADRVNGNAAQNWQDWFYVYGATGLSGIYAAEETFE